MKTDRKRRHEPGFSLLANLLQKNVRTLHRWITKRPQLRRVLRVKQHGKQWRIDYPKTNGEFDAWIAEVRNAVSPFTRTPDRTATSKFAKQFCNDLGFGDEQRERDIEILRHAMLLKYSTRKLRTQDADTEEQAEDNPPSPTEWESEAAGCWSTARMVSAQFNCRVEDVPKHWREFCQGYREKNRTFNAPKENWLKAHGLHERAMQLLPKGSGDLIAFIGTPRADGKPHLKLYRDRHVWKPNNIQAPWRKMFFQTERLQLLPVASDAEINAECARMSELWPDPKHWQRARQQHERDWQLKTLGEAALELVQEGKPVIGENLRRLIFCNQKRQDVWKSHEEHLKLKRMGIDVFCDEETFCKHAKRGISLREFRQRYNEKEMKQAIDTALKADASDINPDAKLDNGKPAVEPEIVENMMQPGEKSQQFIDQAWAAGHRRQIENNPEIEKWFAGLSAEEQKKASALLRDPFSDGKSRKESKPQTKLASMSKQERERFQAWLDGTA